MSVAIVIASRHGSTREIGEEIAGSLRHHGIGSTLYDASDEVNLSGRTGVIVGSAVYLGKWMKEARAFIHDHHQQLQELPVWLFSSGPIGDRAATRSLDQPMINELTKQSGAIGHTVFLGKLDPSQLSRSERLMSRIVQAPEGDFRDFDAVDAWAEEIADVLLSRRVSE